jgi:hypothetical protein
LHIGPGGAFGIGAAGVLAEARLSRGDPEVGIVGEHCPGKLLFRMQVSRQTLIFAE